MTGNVDGKSIFANHIFGEGIGLDVPVSQQLTANAALNVSFSDDTNVGLLLGVGYNF